MREIKFRAWDFVNKIMDEDIFIDGAGNAYDYASTTYNTPNTEIQRCEFPVMQYTGLKDKNGVEIYEGDIVSDQYANIYTPIFRNGIYMAYNVEYLHLTEQEPSTQFNVVWKNGCDIIGNIYDNPELLEEQTNEQSTSQHMAIR